jgi:hypothetical protein
VKREEEGNDTRGINGDVEKVMAAGPKPEQVVVELADQERERFPSVVCREIYKAGPEAMEGNTAGDIWIANALNPSVIIDIEKTVADRLNVNGKD